MDFWDGAESEREELTPDKGFNVCYYDEWGKFGENLTIWKWFATEQEAEAYANEKRAEGDTIYVLGRRGETNNQKNNNSNQVR